MDELGALEDTLQRVVFGVAFERFEAIKRRREEEKKSGKKSTDPPIPPEHEYLEAHPAVRNIASRIVEAKNRIDRMQALRAKIGRPPTAKDLGSFPW